MATTIATIEGTTIELGFDAEAREALAKYAEAKKAKANAEKVIAEADALLKEKMGKAQFGTVGGVPVLSVVTVENRVDIDRKALKERFAEAWKACSYKNPYSFLKLL
jgi:predicted phage-related endonuclease